MAQTFFKNATLPNMGNMNRLRKLIAALKSLTFGPYVSGGAIQRTLTYLIMSHDSNEIYMTLKDDQPYLQGPAEGRSEHFKRMKKIMGYALGRYGAKTGHSYFYGRDNDEVTVHPLGGANMSRDGSGNDGVTNHLGEVFMGSESEVHPGLVCCDASVIPTALGGFVHVVTVLVLMMCD
jgi:GMC oxidoreductase